MQQCRTMLTAPDMIKQRIGANIRRHRKHLGLTQEELADSLSEALGKRVHHQAVSRWERGDVEPGNEVKTVLAELFEIDVGDLDDKPEDEA